MLILISVFVLIITDVICEDVNVTPDITQNAVEIPLDKGVMVLGEDTFQRVIDDNPLVLVDFYAPWCKHCQKLELEFATAAWMLSETKSEAPKAKFAKVDAIAHAELAKHFDITRYPTLIFFKNGIVKPFTGGSNSDSIYQWVRKKSEDPTKLIETKEDFNELVTKPDVAVLGFFKDLQSPEALAFTEAADDNMVIPFGITSTTELFQLFRVVDDSGVIILKKFDEGMNRLEGDISSETVTTFVDSNSQPLVMEFKTETSKKIFQGFQVSPNLLLFMSSKTEKFEEVLQTVKSVAKDFRGDIKFVSIDTDVEDNLRIMEFLGLAKKDIPTFRLTSHEDDLIKYKPASEELIESNIRTFIKDFKAGKLKPHLNRQELPADWDENPVKVLVASNFDEVISDTTKNVFVEFYAPWCGHCKRIAPVWEELGDKFKDVENVLIAKMDMTSNQLETLKVKGFPTFKLYRAGDNEEVDYTGPRNIQGLVEFLTQAVEVKEEPKDEL